MNTAHIPAGTLAPMRRRLRPFALVLGLAWLESGCHSWRTAPTGARVLTEAKAPSHIRITKADGRRIHLYNPRLLGDTLVGEQARWLGGTRRVALTLDSLTRVEVLKYDGTKTAILIVGVGVTAALIVAAAVAMSNMGPIIDLSGCCESTSGSCPLIYSWDGHAWRLDSGTFAGAVARGLARTESDVLESAVARNGIVRLRLANELAETDYVDALTVTAVDHPAGVTVLPDAQGGLHAVGVLGTPIGAVDDQGHERGAEIARDDGWYWESTLVPRDSADPAALRDGLELTFLRPRGAMDGHLALEAVNTPWAVAMTHRFVEAHGRATQAWYDSLAAMPVMAALTRQRLEAEASLVVSVWDGRRWVPQGSVWSVGPESPKLMAVELDLAAVPGDTVRVRLESVPSFWAVDYAALSTTADAPTLATDLVLTDATDSAGTDRSQLLEAMDGRTLRLDSGDRLDLAYAALPPRAGMARSYVLRSTGWYELRTRTTDEPQVALLDRVGREPGAIARLSIGLMNDALRLAAAGRR